MRELSSLFALCGALAFADYIILGSLKWIYSIVANNSSDFVMFFDATKTQRNGVF